MKAGKWFARLLALVLAVCAFCAGTAEEVSGADFRAGEYVRFGAYPQTADGADRTPIEWLVLESDGESALLISRRALDCRPYHNTYAKTTWDGCALRAWLNGEFYEQAFDADERERVLQTSVSADKNPSYSSNPGRETTDHVFILSVNEVNRYFANDAARACAPTDYALQRGALVSDGNQADDGCAAGWFWLRTPGYRENYAALVGSAGIANAGGCHVNGNFVAVRPCVRVRLS